MGALFANVVAASTRVAGTRSRKAKVAALGAVLADLEGDEVEIAVAFLTGEPRQGRFGVGWATLRDLAVAPAVEPALSLRDVDTALTELAAIEGPGSAGRRRSRLAELFAEATSAETNFLWRLLTGELRQGALEGVMSEAIATAWQIEPAVVRRAAMLLGDLAATARRAHEGGTVALGHVGLQVLRPISPMLAATAPSIGDALADLGRSSVELKLDGARVQVHRRGHEVRVFTRNLNEISTRLPEVVARVREYPSESFILDGEVLGFFDDASPLAFQDSMSRFGAAEPGHRTTLTAYFFDCLHRDGTDLLDRPLDERIAALDRLVGRDAIPRLVTDDPGAAAAFLAAAVSAGHEGVMVKDLASPYEAGRRGQSWRKVKPVHTLDLVVLAAEWGHGRRTGWLSNLHLGARTDRGFVMVGKTFKGLTDELLAWQTAELLARETRTDERGHVVHVRPELVVEIALDGVQRSTRYPGGVALRFARVRRFRADKAAAEADTLDEVQRLLPRRG